MSMTDTDIKPYVPFPDRDREQPRPKLPSNWTQAVVAIAAIGALSVSVYNATQINQVHIIMNSRLTELLLLTRQAANAEGRAEGRAIQKKSDDDASKK